MSQSNGVAWELALKKWESRHNLASAVYFHRLGGIRDRAF